MAAAAHAVHNALGELQLGGPKILCRSSGDGPAIHDALDVAGHFIEEGAILLTEERPGDGSGKRPLDDDTMKYALGCVARQDEARAYAGKSSGAGKGAGEKRAVRILSGSKGCPRSGRD